MVTDFNQALNAFQRGEFAIAESICTQLVCQDPCNADAANLLGITAGTRGDHARAIEFFRRACTLNPSRMIYFRNLYRSLLSCRMYAEAEAEIRAANSRFDEQNQAELNSMLLTVLGVSGRLEEAIGLARNWIQAAPGKTEQRFVLSELYRRHGDMENAENELKAILQIDACHQDALNNLAGLLMARGDFLDAMKCVERLLNVDPRSAKGNLNLGSLLSAAGDVDSAIVAFRNALHIDPGLSKAKFQLANLLMQNGRLEEAQNLLSELSTIGGNQRALTCARARLYERRGDIRAAFNEVDTLSEEDKGMPAARLLRASLLEQLGRIAEGVEILLPLIDEQPALSGVEWAEVHFSLGPMFEALGRFDEAFEHVRLGNEQRRRAFINSQEQANVIGFGRDDLQRLFSSEIMSRCPFSSLDTELPIFILGMPRSGTTLTEQILGRHPDVHPAGELAYFRQIMRDTHLAGMKRRGGALTIIDSENCESRELLVPKNWENITSQELSVLGRSYLDYLSKHDSNALRITDKMPYNFFVVPLIQRVFPKARIIHCQRHPLDTCISCYFQNFNSGNQFTFDLRQLGSFYRDYHELMEFWRNVHQIPMFHLNYEDLVRNPQQVVPELLEFCGLPFHEECLHSHKSKRVVNTASYQQVRKPIYTSSDGRWKNYVRHLSPLIEALGLDAELLNNEGIVRFLPLAEPKPVD